MSGLVGLPNPEDDKYWWVPFLIAFVVVFGTSILAYYSGMV